MNSPVSLRLAGAFVAGAALFAILDSLRKRFLTWGYSTDTLSELLAFVHQKAEYGNADQVIAAVEQFLALPGHDTMVIGDKVPTLEDELKKKNPKVVLELGGYFGYSALKMARLLDDDAKLFSVEPDPIRAAVSTRLLEHAGLAHKVHVVNDFSDKVIDKLRPVYGVKSVDFVFIDHVKHRYLQDLKLLESKEGMLKPGTVLVADNVKFPGAPDYKKYVTTSPRYKTVVVPYRKVVAGTFDDEVTVSIVQ
eukprot:TRINITY_DN1020_c0_g1_i2.p1 TRINITY_DN1020_c0_g1~~TRINITY_DN1020_c0_g1_i2.p1  ORF type:complete len:283 (-),score=77.97 TRINITY_DN1020_c0_g1_i2:65-814(-)